MRPRSLAAPLALLVLAVGGPLVTEAGGAPGDYCPAAGPVVSDHAGSRYRSCLYDVGAQAIEPYFGFLRDGRVLYETDRIFSQTPYVSGVRRSAPPYRTWTDVSPRLQNTHATTLDPRLYVDPRTQRVFTFDFAALGAPVCSELSYSDDGGSTWTASSGVCGGFDGQDLGAGPPATSTTIGYPDVVYYCSASLPATMTPTTTPICSKSIDGGLTFAPTGSPPFPAYASNNSFSSWGVTPVVGPDGTLYVSKRFEGRPEIAVSRDEGLTWTRYEVAGNGSGGQTPRMTVDAQGNLYYSWVDTARHLPYVAYSRDHGRHWSTPLSIGPRGLRETALPWVSVDVPGRIAVAYLGSTDAPGKPPWYSPCLGSCDEGAYTHTTWNGYLTVVDSLFSKDPTIVTGAVKRPGHPLFTGGCSAELSCKASGDVIQSHFAPDHSAWGSYSDDCALSPNCHDAIGEGVLLRLQSVPFVSH